MYFVKKNEDKKMNFMDEFFDSFMSGKALKTDIVENDNNYTLNVEMPGIDKKNINLNFDNHYLTISVDQKNEAEEANKKYIRKERSSYSYSRSYYLENADEHNIKAKLDNGILTVIVNKNVELNNKKTISIE